MFDVFRSWIPQKAGGGREVGRSAVAGGWLAGSNEVCSVDLPCVPMFVVVHVQPIK